MKPSTAAATETCEHCGTPFFPREPEERFCCHGCRYVSQLIRENGFERFYELKGERSVPPVGSKVFDHDETGWLRAAQTAAETAAKGASCQARFSLEGISCIACVWLVEAVFRRQPGAEAIRIDTRNAAVELTWQRELCSLGAFAAQLRRLGYRLAPYAPSAHGGGTGLGQRIGLCGFFLMNTMLFTLPGYLGMGGDFFLSPLFQMLGAAFATFSMVVGGGYFIHRAWQAIRAGTLHIDLPIALGLVAAYSGSLLGWATGFTPLVFFDFVATFVFLMLVGRWLQEQALERNRAHLQRNQPGPRHVTCLGGARDGERVPVEQVQSDQEYGLAPGDINPVAAEIRDAGATLSLEWINGEPEPVAWPEQRVVPAGAVNVGLTELRLRATESWEASLLARLLHRPPETFRDERLQRVLKRYILAVMAIACLGGSAWLFAGGGALMAIQVFISVLIVSCPCALGVTLPMCDEFAQQHLRRVGLFVKNAAIWERLRRVKTVVFDKTGTLTMDVPALTNPEALDQLNPIACRALLRLVDHNPHPIARSLRETLLARCPDSFVHAREDPDRARVDEHIGCGVAWTDPGGNRWTLGKPTWQAVDRDAAADKHHTVLRQNGLPVAAFDFREDVRDEAAAAVAFLQAQNLDTAILSGDGPARVRRIAAGLGLAPERARAECSPDDKAAWIARHAAESALMIGDGANDSLAFDRAVCRGTPVVDRSILEASADFFFFGRSLRSLPYLFRIAARRRFTVAVVFTIALLYNIAAVGVCLAGQMHPLLAAILMPLSSIATLAVAWGLLGRRL